MPLPTFDATVAGPGATSYVSVAEADTMLAVRPGGAPGWANAPDQSAQELALMQATQILGRESWVGVIATADQALPWPRAGVDVTFLPLDAGTIPDGVRQATAELAERLLAGNNVDPAAPTGLAALAATVKSVKAGPVTLDLATTAGAVPSATEPGSTLPLVVRTWVARYLRPLTAPFANGVLAGTLRVVRAS